MVLLYLFWREGFVLSIRPNVNGLSYGVVPGIMPGGGPAVSPEQQAFKS
jgi:hypothetical protein